MRERLSEIVCEALQTSECIQCCDFDPEYCQQVKAIVEKLMENGVMLPD